MIATFLITLREVIEASLIVATILGILIRLRQFRGVRTVWLATGAAAAVSTLLLMLGSVMGIRIQELYSGKLEEFIEGILMMVSACFMTWAVFFLHHYFGRYKTRLLVTIRKTAEQQELNGLFWLAFTAVLREGFEIVLFLSAIFFSSNPSDIFTGFAGGVLGGLLISFGLFAATLRLPVVYAFRTTSILLILFAGGLFARGIHEFTETGIIPEMMRLTLGFIPPHKSFAGDMVNAVFGLTRTMDMTQLFAYGTYVLFMTWWVFFRKETTKTVVAETDEN